MALDARSVDRTRRGEKRGSLRGSSKHAQSKHKWGPRKPEYNTTILNRVMHGVAASTKVRNRRCCCSTTTQTRERRTTTTTKCEPSMNREKAA